MHTPSVRIWTEFVKRNFITFLFLSFSILLYSLKYLTFETLQKGTKKNHKYILSTSCFKVYTRNECSNALWILTDRIIFVSKLFNFVRTTGLHPFVILSDISCFKHQMEVLRATSHERLSTWPIHKWPLLMAIAGELSLSV